MVQHARNGVPFIIPVIQTWLLCTEHRSWSGVVASHTGCLITACLHLHRGCVVSQSLSVVVITCRLSANVRGTVGLPTPGTQVVVVDPVTHTPVPDGQQGLVLAAGPGVMTGGYYSDTAATQKAFIDGWFDTGEPHAAC